MWCYFEFWFFFALVLSQKFFVLKSHKSAPFKPWNVKSLCIQYNYRETIKALFLNEINCYYSFKSIKALKTGLIKCQRNFSNGFLKNEKFVGVDQITCKNCNKSSWMQVNKILLTHDRPQQFPSFLYSVFNGIKPLWDEAAFPKLIVFFKN